MRLVCFLSVVCFVGGAASMEFALAAGDPKPSNTALRKLEGRLRTSLLDPQWHNPYGGDGLFNALRRAVLPKPKAKPPLSKEQVDAVRAEYGMLFLTDGEVVQHYANVLLNHRLRNNESLGLFTPTYGASTKTLCCGLGCGECPLNRSLGSRNKQRADGATSMPEDVRGQLLRRLDHILSDPSVSHRESLTAYRNAIKTGTRLQPSKEVLRLLIQSARAGVTQTPEKLGLIFP